MGWTGVKAASAEAAVDQILVDVKLLAPLAWRGSCCWALAETRTRRPLIVWLVTEYQGGYWYVKEVGREHGTVNRYDPPRDWLELAPPTGAFGTDWRLKVAAHYAAVDLARQAHP